MKKMTIQELLDKIKAKKKQIKPCPIPHVDPVDGPIPQEEDNIHHGEPIPVDPPIKPKPVDK